MCGFVSQIKTVCLSVCSVSGWAVLGLFGGSLGARLFVSGCVLVRCVPLSPFRSGLVGRGALVVGPVPFQTSFFARPQI